MKTRCGFVSNSSTSSFTCDICGEEYSGWDASPGPDYGCVSCENEHGFCESHLEDYKAEMSKIPLCEHEFDRDTCEFCPECGEPRWDDLSEYSSYELPSAFCPVCQFVTYAEHEMAAYLEKTRKITRDEVFAKIKEQNRRRRKLYDGEYVTYVCEKFGLTDDILLKELKDTFCTFDKFAEFIFNR